VGLTFNFEKIERAPNTLLSHRLVALAPEEKRQAVLDAVYEAYFEQGRDIGDLGVLLEVAAAQGMDAEAVGEQLRGDVAREEVLAEARMAHQLGITGVPFFVLNGRYGLSGAQPPAVLLQAMKTAAEGVA
jgi:predicted DsbA family dithiol-disulfide isomerase